MVVDSYLVETVDARGSHPDPVHDARGRALRQDAVRQRRGLGAIAELTGVVEWDSLSKAVMARVPEGTEELNQKALDVGRKAAMNAREKNH